MAISNMFWPTENCLRKRKISKFTRLAMTCMSTFIFDSLSKFFNAFKFLVHASDTKAFSNY